MTTLQTVIHDLRLNDFPVVLVTEGSKDTDAIVTVSESVYLQVGTNYLMVVRVEGEGDATSWKHYPERRSMPGILEDLHRALRRAPVAPIALTARQVAAVDSILAAL